MFFSNFFQMFNKKYDYQYPLLLLMLFFKSFSLLGKCQKTDSKMDYFLKPGILLGTKECFLFEELLNKLDKENKDLN